MQYRCDALLLNFQESNSS